MIVAVRVMRMVEMSTHDVINVIAVWRAFMPAFWTVSMVAAMCFAFVIRRAATRVGTAYRNGVLVDVSFMDVMQMSVMKIVRVSLMANRRVAATGTMFVAVLGMRCTLTVFHIFPFELKLPV